MRRSQYCGAVLLVPFAMSTHPPAISSHPRAISTCLPTKGGVSPSPWLRCMVSVSLGFTFWSCSVIASSLPAFYLPAYCLPAYNHPAYNHPAYCLPAYYHPACCLSAFYLPAYCHHISSGESSLSKSSPGHSLPTGSLTATSPTEWGRFPPPRAKSTSPLRGTFPPRRCQEWVRCFRADVPLTGRRPC